jgi:hypothetical protein
VGRILGTLVAMVLVVAIVVCAAPYVLGVFVVVAASRTPQGRGAIAMARELQPEMQAQRMREAMRANAESMRVPHSSVVETDYSRNSDFPSHPRAAPVPGQPMLDPTPSR